ncbi:MAG: addiction module protein [Gammaproteobacteria bacterium HGW-Gammaproteobacteria-1]|jgi:putative addiction module component (TIGR02574 family)|nr:MAG: addiction module protein [Gammaproteobacteria bacterium HGW-Gammaproteobacteria-1]
MSGNLSDYKALSIAERIQLVEDIWDSIAQDSPGSFALTEAQRMELQRRLDAHRQDPSTAIPWAEVRDQLLQRRG